MAEHGRPPWKETAGYPDQPLIYGDGHGLQMFRKSAYQVLALSCIEGWRGQRIKEIKENEE